MPTRPQQVNEPKVVEVFLDELQKIQNHDIRKFVLWVFDKFCPYYFWTCPCSTSGKYHPKVSLGVGGLVRHVKLAVWWGEELLRTAKMFPELVDHNTEHLHDEVIAALLLHDLIKNGEGLNAQGYALDRGVTGIHGVDLAGKIQRTLSIEHTSDSVINVLSGVARHMGVWTTNQEFRPNDSFTRLVHLADYCASRKVDDEMKRLEGNQ
ncbi:hypothetical protein LCGC14_2904650 [marine sediment metagenome]|uniref:Uncharacterized protein n=1 Tax=marine sediment metagenome TaxID=412755 RepID=A0A0F8YFB9_9ZZZZ